MSERIRVIIDAEITALIPGFLANRLRDVEALRAGVAKRDFATLRIIGHSMKGTGGGYGFAPITAFGDAIETAALAEDESTILQTTALLADYLARVEPVFE